MSELEKLNTEYEAKVNELQEKCPHPDRSDWLEHQWAIGHLSGYCVKLCNRCGKVLEKKDDQDIPLGERPFWALPSETRLNILKESMLKNCRKNKSLEHVADEYFGKGHY